MKNKLLNLLPILLFYFTSINAQIQQIDVPIQQVPCNVNKISSVSLEHFNIFFDNSNQMLSFSVSNRTSKKDISLHVVSMLGQSVYTSNIISAEQNYNGSVKLPHFNKGIYYVIIHDGYITGSKKIFVL